MLTAKIDVRLVSILRLEHLLSYVMCKVLAYRLKWNVQVLNVVLSSLVVKDVIEFQFERGTLGSHMAEGPLKKFLKFFGACFGRHSLRHDINDELLPSRPHQIFYLLAFV